MKKKQNKKWTVLGLCGVLLLTLGTRTMPQTVKGAQRQTIQERVYLASDDLEYGETGSDSYFFWDASEKKLEMKNVDINVTGADLALNFTEGGTLVLYGQNTLNLDGADNAWLTKRGIYFAKEGSIEGTGSLTCNVKAGNLLSSAYCIDSAADLTIGTEADGPELILSAQAKEGRWAAGINLFAVDETDYYPSVCIKNTTVYVDSSSAEASEGQYGIYVEETGTVTILDSSITVKTGDAKDFSNHYIIDDYIDQPVTGAVMAQAVTISNSQVELAAGDSEAESYGIFCEDSIEVNDSKVTAYAGNIGEDGYSLGIIGNLVVDNSIVELWGQTNAFGTVDATLSYGQETLWAGTSSTDNTCKDYEGESWLRITTESAPSTEPEETPEPETTPNQPTANEPVVDTKPETANKPVIDTKPETANKPVIDTKPETANKPVVDTKPETANKPVVDTKPETANKPVVDTKPETANKPVIDTKPETDKKPTVTVDQNQGQTVIKNTVEELVQIIPDISDYMEQGHEVEVVITVQPEKKEVSKEVQDAIKREDGYQVGTSLQIQIDLRVDGSNPVAVNAINGKLTVEVEIPEELRQINRTFKVIASNGSKTEVITPFVSDDQKMLTLEIDKDTEYTLIYSDEVPMAAGPSDTIPQQKESSKIPVWVKWIPFLLLLLLFVGVYEYQKRKIK